MKKILGQNFLINDSISKKIVEFANFCQDDEIIEIGVRVLAVNKDNYRDVKAVAEYESYNDTDIEVAILQLCLSCNE